jgi:hypothetical protein
MRANIFLLRGLFPFIRDIAPNIRGNVLILQVAVVLG